jgi:PAS domain-containing protein
MADAAKRPKDLALILGREFASMLATPMFVVDGTGRLVYCNEPAEDLLGRSFAEIGRISAEDWVSMFVPETAAGEPMPLEAVPSRRAFVERRHAHSDLRITSAAGIKIDISSTAFPIFVREGEFLGVIAIFWRR